MPTLAFVLGHRDAERADPGGPRHRHDPGRAVRRDVAGAVSTSTSRRTRTTTSAWPRPRRWSAWRSCSRCRWSRCAPWSGARIMKAEGRASRLPSPCGRGRGRGASAPAIGAHPSPSPLPKGRRSSSTTRPALLLLLPPPAVGDAVRLDGASPACARTPPAPPTSPRCCPPARSAWPISPKPGPTATSRSGISTPSCCAAASCGAVRHRQPRRLRLRPPAVSRPRHRCSTPSCCN